LDGKKYLNSKPHKMSNGVYIESTIERIKQYAMILAIQDTTELDYSTHKSTRD
jgi:hypothetical protein